ncbi:DHA2 family efflux MFS transporter permease subunit [Aeromicrobium camelliae]|uniref:DHA2 family efflux MFS transporter permease subunit n=1 Tax=Aeromicrobium camelliae TaxID=1538144 RepID=A0A3N6W469_9ACTN|nr:DHA2 family efflux MFS transporter permease subunit [Aeromicrobium camelliae]RQN02336.1 DHA2 family efflux MFS transporter permease subunit [Aeromicrobium camelliae]
MSDSHHHSERDAEPAGTERLSGRVLIAVIAAGLTTFAGIVVETSMNITFPTLMAEFEVSTEVVQWMTTGYLLVVATMVPLSSVLVRRFTTRSLFVTAVVLFAAGVVMDAVAPDYAVLLAGRLVQGVGTGIALPLMFNIILHSVPPARLGMMMGVGTAVTAVGPAVGPTFGGVVVSALGWRWIFWILLPVLLVSLLLGLWAIRQGRPTERVGIDVSSVLALAVTFTALVYGLNQAASEGWTSWRTLGPLAVGLIAGALFVLRSRRIAQPLIRLDVFSSVGFRWAVAALFLLQFITLGLSYLLPNQIQDVLGFTALVAGLLVLPGAVVGAIMSPLGGRLLDKLGPTRPVAAGYLAALTALVAFAIVSRSMGAVVIIVIYVAYMLGNGLVAGNTLTLGVRATAGDLSTDANAALNTVQQVAGAFGTAIVTTIVATSQGAFTAGDGDAYVEATRTGTWHAYIALAICGALALASAIGMLRASRSSVPESS